jgi:hypothetical protein
VLDEVEWFQPIHNGNPRCPSCEEPKPSSYTSGDERVVEGGHEPGCRLKRLIADVERSGKEDAVASKPDKDEPTTDEPRHQYIVAVIRVAVIEEVETIDMPRLLNKYREDGAAELVSADIRTLTYVESNQLLQKLAEGD